MADKAITRRLKIYINGAEVDATLSNLRKSLSKFRAQANRAVEGTPEWKKYNAEVARLETELKQATSAQKKFREETGLSTKAVTKAKNGLTNIFPSVSGAILFTDALKGALRFTKEFLTDAVKMAEEARGIEFAFIKLGDEGEDAFLRVKAATRGLLSDLEIKRSLVEFDNFNISLEESATLFEFLTVRATQTGESVDKLKSSLVEGLSKESKLRIDNLGISTAVLNAELEKTPNFVQAVANIAKVEIAKAGTILDDAASSNQKWNATLQNTQLRLGKLINASRIIPFFQKLGASILDTLVPMEKASAATEKERLTLLTLESKLKDVNITTADRLKLINELKEKYPTLLSNIDAETVSNEELTTAIREVNNQLINKIILQDKDGEIAKQNEITAEKRIDLLNQEDKVRNQLVLLAEKHGKNLKSNVSLTEQSRDLLQQLGQQTGGRLINPVVEFSHQLNVLEKTQTQLNIATNAGNKLLEEKNDLFKKLNISQDVLNGPEKNTEPNTTTDPQEGDTKTENGGGSTGTPGADNSAEEEANKIIEQKKKVAEYLKQFEQEQEIQKAIEDLEKDEAAQLKEELELENRYAKLEEEANGEKQLLSDLEEAKNTELAAIKDKWNDKFIADNKKYKDQIAEDDKKFKEESIKAEEALQNARIAMLSAGLSILKSFTKEGSMEYKILFGMEKLATAARVVLAGQAERAAYAANPVWSLYPDGGATIKAKHILASKIRTGISLATIAATTIQGLEDGGETWDGPSSGGLDGRGGRLAVHHPGEYMIPRPVMQMPEVPRIVAYLEAKRTGKNIDSLETGGAVDTLNSDTLPVTSENAYLISTLNKLDKTLQNLKINYTLEDEQARKLLEQKLNDTINASEN